MKKSARREFVWNVLALLVEKCGGHCYIMGYDKNGVAVSTSPILVKEEGDDIVAIIDGFFDLYFPDPERIRTIVAGDIIEPATVHEYTTEGRHYCYVKGNYRIEGISLNVFDQCPYAKRRTIKAEKDCINIACQYSEDEEFTQYFKRQDDIIIK